MTGAALPGEWKGCEVVAVGPPSRHLLVVATNYAENSGGVQAHLAHLCPRLVEREVAVTLVYLGQRARRRVEGEVEVVSLRRRADVRDVVALPDPRDWRGLSALVRRGGLLGGMPTHVATHTRFFPMSWLGLRLGHSLGLPVVHTEHGAGSVVTGGRAVEAAGAVVDRTMGRWVLRHADVVLAVSDRTAGFVSELSGVVSRPFANGVDLDFWLDGPRVGVPGLAPRDLVFVGRLVPEKGWRTFVDIAARLHHQGLVGHVTLLGQGPLQEVMAYAEQRSVPVTVTGQVDPEQVRAALRDAVYVNPSVAAEGFQLTLVEAAAAGASVVTYDVGVARELSDSGAADVAVVPTGDAAALEAAARTALLGPVRPADPAVLARWDWADLADRYVAVLDDVVR